MSDIDAFLSAYPRIHFACKSREVRSADRGVSLTPHQAGILSHLDAFDPVMVGELAEHLGVTTSTMSLNLTRLERAGFITRERDPADRRVMNVLLTEAGEQVRDSQTDLDPERVDQMLRTLDPDARMAALRGLGLLAEAADNLIRNRDDYVEALTES
ncbi:MAG: MarR family winged helix-turn-helix transcriptional regulator [Gemmatimonadetes bacterium]|jgi:MarR family transcriptional regulator, organic hydroperoxide resistance regulator|nr:MarR family winged helix-turn-helix transcriptional regulator [Gemmatimonadota bacterium]